jgi:hypothetical protein
MRMVVAVIAVVATLSPLFAAETIPCIVINGKAYAPAAFLPLPGAVSRERTMAGHSFVWIREYAEAVGGELINEGGLRLRCGELDVAAFSLHQAERYWQSADLRTACPTVWAAAQSCIAPHVGTSLRSVPRPKPQRPRSTLPGPAVTPLRRPQSAVAVQPSRQSELDALRAQLQRLDTRYAELNRQIDSFGPLGPPLAQRMPVFDEAQRVNDQRIRINARILQLLQQ